MVVHRAHKRAVLHAGDTYIKVFRPEQAPAAARNHMLATAPLAGGPFRTPALTGARPDVLVFSSLAGRSYLRARPGPGHRHRRLLCQDVGEWSRAWTDTVVRANGSAFRGILEQLPLLDAEEELAKLRRWIDHWLLHSEGIPEAAPGRAALVAQADAVRQAFWPGATIPWGGRTATCMTSKYWAADKAGAPGLLDFDEACRAEAALDLANLDVHLELRRRQKLLTARRFAIAHASIVPRPGACTSARNGSTRMPLPPGSAWPACTPSARRGAPGR